MMRRLVATALALAVLGIAALTFAPLLWRIVPKLAVVIPMAPQFAAAAAVIGVVALLLRRRRLAVLAALALGWNLVQVWPDIAPGGTAEANAPVLTVLSFNLWYDNTEIARTADALAASGADVIGLVEATPALKAGLTKLQAVYPYSIDCVDDTRRCQTMLFSKYPLTNAYSGPIDGRFPHIALAEIDKPGMPPVVVAVTHLSWPFATRDRPPLVATAIDRPDPELPDVPALQQSVQAANLAAFLAKQPADLVLMGDFNSASWSPLLISLRAATGLAEHRRLLPSWPSMAWPIFRIPIDHVSLAAGRASSILCSVRISARTICPLSRG
jgi:endonuclease/exonuclease/phosphatase (EEP) superfamily protein YafD